jgi:hypothetical protein
VMVALRGDRGLAEKDGGQDGGSDSHRVTIRAGQPAANPNRRAAVPPRTLARSVSVR